MTFPWPTTALPRPHDGERRRTYRERWRERGERCADPSVARDMEADSQGAALLDTLFGNSPFLSELALSDPVFTALLWRQGPSAATGVALEGMKSNSSDTLSLRTSLRQAKRRVALVTALADIAGVWQLVQVTGTLSHFAEQALRHATDRALLDLEAMGQLQLGGDAAAAGLTVLGMGKLGAGELNYSSDIDLIVLYDRELPAVVGDDGLGAKMVRATRALVGSMSEITADGYVFRTDLRLRPDPGSTPLAISTIAAETYYESVGQNWERAAMIKARPVAGNIEVGDAFLRMLRPYVWRKHLDFAAIHDIHSIKRQIDAHRGTGTVKVAGHNVKLGRGGIREIEFFVQTQQLIYGGRNPALRMRGTVGGLNALAEAGLIQDKVARELAECYGFLRRVEHRLQMVDDRQTHVLPADEAGLAAIATFMGYAGGEPFAADLLRTFRTVESHYARLFEDAPSLAAPGAGSLVFTGIDADPETLTTLTDLGFRETAVAWQIVSRWHHGRYRATQTARARELLTELKPALLKALAATVDPDQALLRFDTLLANLPAGVQLFSLFKSNPSLLDLVARIMGSAPRIANHLARRPILLDSVLSADFLAPLPDAEILAADLGRILDGAGDEQDLLDFARRWTNDRRFQVGVHLLSGAVTPRDAARAYSDVATAVVAELTTRVEALFARQHGGFDGPRMAVVAMGKLGSREMTATSDLDLMFVYDIPEGLEQSDGARPLPPPQYYTRLSQRVLNALTVQTNDGALYEVDMRLRPSGNSGPIACSLAAFDAYQATQAWTWEHMALCRARVIAGSPAIRERVATAIEGTLRRPRDADKLLRDVADMRARVATHRPPKGPWDFKLIRGGLFDVDFVVQYLCLRHAAAHPGILRPDPLQALAQLEQADLVAVDHADRLSRAYRLFTDLQGLMRLAIDGSEADFDEAKAPEGLRQLLVKVDGVARIEDLKRQVILAAEMAYDVFVAIIEKPAAALPAPAPAEDKA
ncbi:bifunctional [glutamine synthetase] adenylyltransferase/[glutamine synthetase]-adenylyl-L-tyrosine phosphorylase [Reyranella sp. CPCC 100927]|uniref:bifunctional [glutamine synthetase] adenylyltransferase/[glutamine synthetase]-adenylyl-L-tyrosine phosphorylase n=1 Tax=Reyranella sp. CPCC 100927 TaxID=2599616 RepID=UPI0011B77ED8|nr:bifunctional [glutamine synthetase] adenylyltransferase/[glutamine synthetase]-adenylyl-L-tyrosine phosphorylase [Reyranella sp. CPCC 100927]TWT00675.1 bifunctional [glutamine synthetase] adenylyltransferase/[glutamine synthetase]-adenylyl-L-tyrosine phosphorylase [Reyranella sp. CPCC 100927]